jgi:hypothetical protein
LILWLEFFWIDLSLTALDFITPNRRLTGTGQPKDLADL